jgi:hypothetical protein
VGGREMAAGPYEPVKDVEDASEPNLGWRTHDPPQAAAAWVRRAGLVTAGCLAVAGLAKTSQLSAVGMFHDSAVSGLDPRAKVRVALASEARA